MKHGEFSGTLLCTNGTEMWTKEDGNVKGYGKVK